MNVSYIATFQRGPIDLRLTCRSYILDALFRDTQLNPNMWPKYNCHKPYLAILWGVFERAKFGQVGYP